MERVLTFLVAFSAQFAGHSLPINSGFTLKFSPVSAKDDVTPKQFGALFAKISQGKPQDETEPALNTYVPYAAELGTGCSNQIARIIFPTRISEKGYSETHTWEDTSVLNLPLFSQPYSDYKILVATAPPNMKLGGEQAKHLVVYLVFPDDENENGTVSLPVVYFVNKLDDNLDVNKKQSMEPIFIIDSNRTVTGLKSKAIAKHVRFTTPLSRRYNYRLD